MEFDRKIRKNFPIVPTDSCLDLEWKKGFQFPMSLFSLFIQIKKLNRVIIAQSFGHLLQKLTSIDCLTKDQSGFTNQKTLLQLKDYALAVSQYKQKRSNISNVCTELKFATGSLINWYNKIKSKNLEIDILQKIKYELSHPIKKDNSVFATF